MTRLKILALVTVFVLSLVIPALVSAQEPRPHAFTGTARLDREAPTNGTLITAYVDGVSAGTGPVSNGRYGGDGSFKVSQPANANYSGKIITFRIGPFPADQVYEWTNGGVTPLNLTGTRQTATNTPAPTNTPTPPPLPPHPHPHRHSHSRAHQYRHSDTADKYTGDHCRRAGPTRSAGRTWRTGRAWAAG